MKIKSVTCHLKVTVQPQPFTALQAGWSVECEPAMEEIPQLASKMEDIEEMVSMAIGDQLVKETRKFFGEAAANKVAIELKKWERKQ